MCVYIYIYIYIYQYNKVTMLSNVNIALFYIS